MDQSESLKTSQHVPSDTEVTSVTPPPTKRKYYIERSRDEMTLSAFHPESQKLSVEERRKTFSNIMQKLADWPNFELWPFKLGIPLLAISASSTGFILNRTFREILLLVHFSKKSSFLVTMGLPVVISGMAHCLSTTHDILMQKTHCPVCVQVRAASVQVAAGVFYPLLFTPIVNYSTAAALKDVYFPKITKDPKAVLKFTVETIRTAQRPLMICAIMQVVAAMGVTYLEQDCFYRKVLPVITGEVQLTKDVSSKRSIF